MDKQYLYRILKNPIYIGKIQHKGKIYEGQHEAIIPQELFDKAQETLRSVPWRGAITPRTKIQLCCAGWSNAPAVMRR
jgi:site-specific DNA recombinase